MEDPAFYSGPPATVDDFGTGTGSFAGPPAPFRAAVSASAVLPPATASQRDAMNDARQGEAAA